MLSRLIRTLVLCCILLVSTIGYSFADVENFDSLSAPAYFGYVTPNTGLGPFLTFPTSPAVNFNDGVVLNQSGWGNLATTPPNLLATTDMTDKYHVLADGSVLQGYITAAWATPITFVSLDVINGLGAAQFEMFVYAPSGTLIGTPSISLAKYGSAGDVGTLSFSAPAIGSILIDSGQAIGSTDFAIDTVTWTSGVPVPEPSTMLLLGSGLLGLWGLRRKFKK